jgi:uncharacterized protein with HEPN domain
MLSNKAQLALLDIRHNMLAAERFTEGLSFEQFNASDLHFYALSRTLEIISEGRAPVARQFPREACGFALEEDHGNRQRLSSQLRYRG